MAASDMLKLVCVTCFADSPCKQAFGVWQERRPDISEEELDRASSAMGYGAVKYADLKNNRMTNYTYALAILDNGALQQAAYACPAGKCCMAV